MNRADAIDLDIQSEKKECTKCLGENLDLLRYEAHKGKKAVETLKSEEFQIRKGAFLIDVIHMAYQCNESKVVSEASKKLLNTIREL